MDFETEAAFKSPVQTWQAFPICSVREWQKVASSLCSELGQVKGQGNSFLVRLCDLNGSQLMLCRASPVGTRQMALPREHVIPLKALDPSFPLPDFSFGTSKVRTVATQIWN